jgi:hypothetical protein
MDKIVRIQKMYEFAIENSLCKNKKEFAALVGVYPSNLSKAFNGEYGFLTEKFLLRVNNALNNAFSVEWILYGKGDMFAQSAPAEPEQEVSVSTRQPVQEVVVSSDPKRVELLESLVKTLQHEVDLLERYNNHLEEENEALKKGNSYVYVRAKDA